MKKNSKLIAAIIILISITTVASLYFYGYSEYEKEYKAATVLLVNGEYDEAIKEFGNLKEGNFYKDKTTEINDKILLAKDLKASELLFEEGTNFLNENKYSEAIEKFKLIKEADTERFQKAKLKLEEAEAKLIAEEEAKRLEAEKNMYVTVKDKDISIPILMYHSISDTDPNNNLLVPPAQFEEQIKWLSENGYTAMLLDEVVQAFETGKVPKKPVVITFDDGCADNYTAAYPILKKYNMKSTFFVITDKIDKDGYYMSSSMLKEMTSWGMDIENHTSNHMELNKLSKEEQILSIKNAQEALKNILNKESKFLCYPVGRYNEITIEVAEALGIKAAVTTNGGMANITDGMYTLDRIRVSPMGIDKFYKLFSQY